MTELTHDQQLWINLLAIFGFIFIAFAAGGYITDKHIKKEERQQAILSVSHFLLNDRRC